MREPDGDDRLNYIAPMLCSDVGRIVERGLRSGIERPWLVTNGLLGTADTFAHLGTLFRDPTRLSGVDIEPAQFRDASPVGLRGWLTSNPLRHLARGTVDRTAQVEVRAATHE